MRAAKKAREVPPPAKPLQIAVTSNDYGGNVVEAITVLMDDGTIWRYPMVGAEPEHRVWVQLPPVGEVTKPADIKE